MMLPQYFFYCAECELKTKAVLFFKTWCPCKEAQCLANIKEVQYLGMAVSQQDWEQMEDDDEKIIGPVNINFMRRSI
jgi:hypothetical protein